MKKLLFISLWFFWLFPIFSYTQNYELTHFVTDAAGVLASGELWELNTQAQLFQQETSHEIATLIIPNRNGRELYDIALEVFRSNGIGSEANNNGVLLVVSSEEKKLRIMVWYGLEWALPDVYVSQLIENDLRPLLNSGQMFELIKQYQIQISETIKSETYSKESAKGDSGSQFVIGFMIGYWLLTLLAGAISKRPLEQLLKSPLKYLLWMWVVAGFMWAIAVGILAGYFGFMIGSLLGSLYRNTGIRSSYNNGGFYSWWGFGWWFWWGGWGFGGFGWWSSGGWWAGD